MYDMNKGKPPAELKAAATPLKGADGKPIAHAGKPLAPLSGPCPGAGCGRLLTAAEPAAVACPYCGQAVRIVAA